MGIELKINPSPKDMREIKEEVIKQQRENQNKEQQKELPFELKSANRYGTTDGKPVVRNINRADQRMINDFTNTEHGKYPIAKRIKNKEIFAMMDNMVIRTDKGSMFDGVFSFFDKWDARCKDAAEKTVEQGKVSEAMQEKLKNGCFDLMHRHDGLDALKEYAKDRQQIIEKEHNVKLNLNYD